MWVRLPTRSVGVPGLVVLWCGIVMAMKAAEVRRRKVLKGAAVLLREAAVVCERGDDVALQSCPVGRNEGVINDLPADVQDRLCYIAALHPRQAQAATIAAVLDEVWVLASASGLPGRGAVARVASVLTVGFQRVRGATPPQNAAWPEAMTGLAVRKGEGDQKHRPDEVQPYGMRAAMDAMARLNARLVNVGDSCTMASVCGRQTQALVRDLVEHDGRFAVRWRKVESSQVLFVVRVAGLPVVKGAGG